MTRAAAFFALLSAIGTAIGQDSPVNIGKGVLSVAGQSVALHRAREYAQNYTARLPNYTCTQVTRQMMTRASGLVGGPVGSAYRVDVIEEQISFVRGREVRTVTKINQNQPSAAERARIFPLSHGDFGNLLDTIFNPKTRANVRWSRAAALDGRRVYVFAFRVPQSSGYELVGARGSVRVPFEGLVYSDRQTGAVVRIEMKCTGIPADSEYRALTLALDYKIAKIAGGQYLLPSGFTMRFEMTSNGWFIGAQFNSCHRFTADSTVEFDHDLGRNDVPAATPEPATIATLNTAIPENAARPENKDAALLELPSAEVLPETPVVAAPPVIVPPSGKTEPPYPDQSDIATGVPQDAVFRASAQLVQVSVIAQDKDGRPVTNLRRDEFQIFDNDKQQELRLFLLQNPDSTTPSSLPPPGTFTNRLAERAVAHTVLLFDSLNVGPDNGTFGNTGRARIKALTALQAIAPGDDTAIYALSCRLQVVREFTTDRDSVLAQLQAFAPSAGRCQGGAGVGSTPELSVIEARRDPDYRENIAARNNAPPVTAEKGADQAPPTITRHETAEAFRARVAADNAAAAVNTVRQIENALADAQVSQLADHLAGIPGRKNLIWLTTDFRLSPQNLRKLIDAGVVIYPVDTLGSTIGLEVFKRERAAGIQSFAAATGGKSYTDREDLDVAIQDALNDGRTSYVLGFYGSDQTREASSHRISVRASRPDVTLRYRLSYSIEAPAPKSPDPAHDVLLAMNRQVDATAIGISASATRAGPSRLNLSVIFDISNLNLESKQGQMTGSAEFVARFAAADGKPDGVVTAQTIKFHLRPATYAAMLQDGYTWREQITIPLNATDLKLAISNLATGKIGTLTIPLSEVRTSPLKGK